MGKVVLQQCQDYRLTTAKILFYAKDFPELLQGFIWKGIDMIPDFPKFNNFLNLLEKNFDGRIESVQIEYVGVVSGEEWSSFSSYRGVTKH